MESVCFSVSCRSHEFEGNSARRPRWGVSLFEFRDKVVYPVVAVALTTLGSLYVKPLIDPQWQLLTVSPEDLTTDAISFEFKLRKRVPHQSVTISFSRPVVLDQSEFLEDGQAIRLNNEPDPVRARKGKKGHKPRRIDNEKRRCTGNLATKYFQLRSVDDKNNPCVVAGVTYKVNAKAADPRDGGTFADTRISWGGDEDLGDRFLRDGPTRECRSWLSFGVVWLLPSLFVLVVLWLAIRRRRDARIHPSQDAFLKSQEGYAAQLKFACGLLTTDRNASLNALEFLVGRGWACNLIREVFDESFLNRRHKDIDGAVFIYEVSLDDFAKEVRNGSTPVPGSLYQARRRLAVAITQRAERLHAASDKGD